MSFWIFFCSLSSYSLEDIRVPQLQKTRWLWNTQQLLLQPCIVQQILETSYTGEWQGESSLLSVPIYSSSTSLPTMETSSQATDQHHALKFTRCSGSVGHFWNKMCEAHTVSVRHSQVVELGPVRGTNIPHKAGLHFFP